MSTDRRRPNSDGPAIKFFVVYILVLETISAVITIIIIYQPLIIDFGRESVLTKLPVGLVAEPAVVVAIATPIHFFVAKRIQRLQRSIWIPLLICIVSVISFAGGIWASVATGRFGRYSAEYPIDMYAPAMLWMVSAAIADSLIAAALSWSLVAGGHSKCYYSNSIALDNQLDVRSSDIVLWRSSLTHRPTLSTFILNVGLMKLYGNFILATLNHRARWNNDLSQTDHQSILFPDMAPTVSTPPERPPSKTSDSVPPCHIPDSFDFNRKTLSTLTVGDSHHFK
ncbi:hypothetical protein NLJ89_g3837 [Agrocybe chaxingu]|uniref:Uncharacterized protein n=1 Tax=Agrocybe chaxingu TaxID=84603 RepID=A0A9W8K414_9AGAR|nr:hypothetical protein NLJ89_g3837 [Agrocybe chaxingu]